MKPFYLMIVIAVIGFTACKSTDSEEKLQSREMISLPFEGIWERSFELGKDSIEDVYYTITTDSIQYEMAGPLSVKYTIHKDTFISKNNQWVGKMNDVYFVIFVKNNSPDSITLFKQQFDDLEGALTRTLPADTVSGHFSSWNTYYPKE